MGSRELRRLGQAMAKQGFPLSDEYESKYDDFLEHYDNVRAGLTAAINSLDICALAGGEKFAWHAVGRTKSRATLLDKLQDGKNLDSIRDVAGVRIVANCTLSQQSMLADALCEHFDAERQVIDRRENPTFGYRALHVEVRIDDTPAEIQIRTRLQHIWAEIYEGLADNWGRQIRYGGEPCGTNSGTRAVRSAHVELLQSASTDTIAALELLQDEVASTDYPNRAARRKNAPKARRLKKLERSLDETLHEWATTLDVPSPRHVPSESEVGRQ